MKNQYFGDVRDLFKYDLAIKILTEIPSIKLFTVIPMLTENDNKSDGMKVDYDKAKAGTNNDRLKTFLADCVKNNKRTIEQLENLFRNNLTIYKPDIYFSHKDRKEYFKDIPNGLLQNSLVLLDPDIGLQVKSMKKEHVLYSDVCDLHDRMGECSVLMIYQHFPRREHNQYLNEISEKMSTEVGNYPIYISDNEIIFLFLAKCHKLAIQNILKSYKEQYDKLYFSQIPIQN